MIVEMTEKEYKAFQAAKAVLSKDERVELIPVKDEIKVVHVRRTVVKK